MATQTFDPNPLNELGRGTLDPAKEAWLLDHGAIFARTVNGIVSWSKRPINDCYRDAIAHIMEIERRAH